MMVRVEFSILVDEDAVPKRLRPALLRARDRIDQMQGLSERQEGVDVSGPQLADLVWALGVVGVVCDRIANTQGDA